MLRGVWGAVLTAIIFLGEPTPALAERLIVFPLDVRNVPFDRATHATAAMLRALTAQKQHEVVDPAMIEASLGVNLVAQARQCEYDVFCLVEVGEILQGAFVLIGHARRRNDAKKEDPVELKLVVLDVTKASMKEVLIWRVELFENTALADAAATASRWLFGQKTAQVMLDVDPAGAKMTVYGEPLEYTPDAPLALWPGVYQARFEAPAYHPKSQRLVVKRGRTTLTVKMDSDPLYVPPTVSSRSAQPFEKSSRRLGSGVSAQRAGAKSKVDVLDEPFIEHPLPLVVLGLGIVAAGTGGVFMGTAQGGYNDLAKQLRFPAPETAETAARLRDGHQRDYRLGSALLLTGVGVGVTGLIWWLIESASDEPPSSRRGAQRNRYAPAAPRATPRFANEVPR